MRLPVLVCLVVCALVSGCARVATTSTLAADGSFLRKVVYTVNPPSTPGDEAPKPTDPETLFKLPKNGDGVKVDKKTDAKMTQTITVERTLLAGAAALQDITLLNEKGEPSTTSTVSVKKLADGNLEYTETLHWSGKAKPETKEQTAKLREVVKAALPADFQKTETIDRATRRALVAAVHVIFGPAEPVFGDIMVNHDGAERRVSRMLFAGYSSALREAIPEMSEADCQTVARKVLLSFGMDQMSPESAAPDPSKPPSENSSPNDMTPLFFEVAFPGTVVESNGILDPVSGTVYWSLFPASLEIEDVTLRVVVRP